MSMMSLCWPKNVIVANRAGERFARRSESLLGREYRFVAAFRLRSGVTLRDLIEREREGDREGT